MRILLLTQVVPYPPDSGPKIKTYNVLRYLAQRHEIHLVSFVRSAAEDTNARALRRYCHGVTTVPLRRSRLLDLGYLTRSLLSGRPFLIERDDRVTMRRALDDLLNREHFDAVHADQLSMAQFAVDLPVRLRVLDEHNAVWTIVRRAAQRSDWGPKRLAAEIEWRKLRAYEETICQRFDRVTVVSTEDRAALESPGGPPLRAKVIPIAVDTEELAFQPRPAEARRILSVATMFYPPNVEGVYWFATEVFPLIRQAAPGVEFDVVGSRPPAKVTQLATPGSGINVLGYVADLEPFLRQSAVLVVPVHSGSGMRVKILEAFARGIPIVSTTIGMEGIAAQPEQHLLVADNPRDFAAAVIRLLRDSALGTRLARAGRDLVASQYDWRTALSGLDEIYPVDSSHPNPLPEGEEMGGFIQQV
ncbi:MAG TPA: glycosyltransferase family 4 protein, partial [Chloroflexota bacterium]|nr:glycosyltransferase family 4 protein [Chloroflexota bacterium]